jgi:putative Mg2+ transporter-C (MgtC) family protein
LDTENVEATYTVFVIAPKNKQREALELLETELEASHYPTRDLTIHAFGNDGVEVEALLSTTSIDGDELDAVIKRLSDAECITQAFWNQSTVE